MEAGEEAEVRRLIVLYAVPVDDQRLDEWAGLFTRDGAHPSAGTSIEGVSVSRR